jgi:GTP-binding protein
MASTPRRGATEVRRRTGRVVGGAPARGLPIVAVVGRPNVGKSTLFNRMIGARAAIVEDRARTTRDRLYGEAEWNGRRFVVVDTGGLERRPGDPIEAKVQEQARLAIAEADVILFVVDAASGETPADLEAAELLRSARVPVVVAINKSDSARLEAQGAEFHRLGWDQTYSVSALHGRGTGDLLDAMVAALPPETEDELARRQVDEEAEAWEREFPGGLPPDERRASRILAETDLTAEDRGEGGDTADDAPGVRAAEDFAVVGADAAGGLEAEALAWDALVEADRTRERTPVEVAIVGRPNVGKSSLLNALLGEERMIVSEIPGTTRDAIDTQITWNGQTVTLIDTAGLRRRGKAAGGAPAERYSVLRALRALGRCDIAILVLDAEEGLARQDAHVAGYVIEEGKGLVVAVNKWDLIESSAGTFDAYVARIRAEAPFLDFAPVIAISAKTGLRVGRVIDAALDIAAERRRRIPTAELNRLLGEATFRQAPPPVRGRRPKFFYGTQAAVAPPTFVLFASDPDRVHFSYKRYLENRIRDAFHFAGTPIRLVFRARARVSLERDRRPRRSAGASGRRPSGGGRPGPAKRGGER